MIRQLFAGIIYCGGKNANLLIAVTPSWQDRAAGVMVQTANTKKTPTWKNCQNLVANIMAQPSPFSQC